MYKKITTAFLYILCATSSFAQNHTIGEINNEISSLSQSKFDNPLQAAESLKKIINYRNLPDSSLGNAYIELSVCYGMMNQIENGTIMANKALPLISNPTTRVYLLKTLGMLYAIRKNNQMADSCFRMAIAGCEKIRENLDMKALVLGEYANYFYENYDYVNNLKLLNQAIEVRNRIKDDNPRYIATLRQKISKTFLAMGDYDFVESENLSIIKLLENTKSDQRFTFLGYAYQNLGIVYQNKKKYDLSDSMLNKSNSYFEKINNNDLVAYSTAQLAKNKLLRKLPTQALPLARTSYETMKKEQSVYILESATIYLNALNDLKLFDEGKQILDDSLVKATLKDNYSSISLEFYKSKIPFLSALQDHVGEKLNYNDILKVSDSIYNLDKLKLIIELQAKYQIQLKEKDEKLLKQENQILTQKNKLNTGLLILSIIIGSVIVLFFLYRNEKNKLLLEVQSNEIKQKEKENQILTQKAEAEEKDKVLKEIIIEQQKQEMLLHIEKIQQLENDLLYSTNKNLESEREEIRKHLHKLKEGKEYLELFMAKFNTLYPNFSQQLVSKYPALNNSDIVFCALVRINLYTKEIGAVLNIEQFSVYRRKYRVMEKMSIKSDDEFKNIIFGI
jgi:hypothetical protein